MSCAVRKGRVAEDCFGTNMHSLKGKTVRKKINPTRMEFAPLPPHIISKYRDITVSADVIKSNGFHLFIFILKNIYFTPQGSTLMLS